MGIINQLITMGAPPCNCLCMFPYQDQRPQTPWNIIKPEQRVIPCATRPPDWPHQVASDIELPKRPRAQGEGVRWWRFDTWPHRTWQPPRKHARWRWKTAVFISQIDGQFCQLWMFFGTNPLDLAENSSSIGPKPFLFFRSCWLEHLIKHEEWNCKL